MCSMFHKKSDRSATCAHTHSPRGGGAGGALGGLPDAALCAMALEAAAEVAAQAQHMHMGAQG